VGQQQKGIYAETDNRTDEISYKIIDTERFDSPLKVMLTNSIVVNTIVKEETLRLILEKASSDAATSVSNYKQFVKQSVIYAYLSEETYRQDKSAWVGKAFGIIGTDDIKIDINKDKLESAHQEVSLNQEKSIQTGKDYPGVYGPDGNYRTKSILPFERRVHDALKREFDFNPEPDRANYSSDREWVRACDKIEDMCTAKVAKQFNISKATVDDIWAKVEMLRY
ncbi:MAG: hypothetical protein ABIH76_03435, partial [Candidatus Bathyarchaeota archaeon]